MLVLGTAELQKAGKKNAPLRKALADWHQKTAAADWQSISDVRAMFPATDGAAIKVSGRGNVVVTVFNIKDNEYRLLTTINYGAARVVILEVLTHAEYSKHAWKDRL